MSSASEWHAARAKVVGGSEVAGLFGVQPEYMMGHYALWHVKAGSAPPPVVEGNPVVWGCRLEEPIANGIAEDNGWEIEKGGHLVDAVEPGLGCTLDFVIKSAPGRDGPGCMEIKNVNSFAHRRSWSDGEPPLHILLQLQTQLAVTGFKWGVVACLVGGFEPQLYFYERRPKIIEQIRQKVAAFWQSIRDGREPPVDGSDSAASILRAIYPELHDDLADLTTDNELPEICAGYLEAAAKRKAAEKEEAEFKNRLVQKMGSHKAAQVQGYTVRTAVTAAKEPTEPPPGYMIPGRAESRRMTIKEAR